MKLIKEMFFIFTMFLFQINQNIICCMHSDSDGEEITTESDDDSNDSGAKKGTIFLLAGTSGCGKTTVLNRLKHTKFDSELRIFEPDKIKDSLIKKHEDTQSLEEDIARLSPFSSPKFDHNKFSKSSDNLGDFEDDETGNLEPEQEMAISIVKKIADQGINVIFDTVLLNRQSPPDDLYEEIKKEFKGYNLCIILVYCPINLLYENTKKRNMIASLKKSSKDSRNIFLALKQFPMIYTVEKTNSSKIIDEIDIKKILELCAQIAPKNDIKSCFLLSLFKEKFGLYSEKSPTFIKPIHHYDFILKNETPINKDQNLNIDGLVKFMKENIN